MKALRNWRKRSDHAQYLGKASMRVPICSDLYASAVVFADMGIRATIMALSSSLCKCSSSVLVESRVAVEDKLAISIVY